MDSARITKYEFARLLGVRVEQIRMNAPILVPFTDSDNDFVIAAREIQAKVIKAQIRRTLPDGQYKDVPLDSLDVSHETSKILRTFNAHH